MFRPSMSVFTPPLHQWHFVIIFFSRQWRTSFTPVQAAVWPPTSWVSAIATTTTSCWRVVATCSTLTSANSWATHRCLVTSNGETEERGGENLFTPLYTGRTNTTFTVVHINLVFLPRWKTVMCFVLFRDRAPFVFTSDMAYVINGGDKPSSRFHDFVDLCCEAYNLIRKHAHLFLNLLGLVS